MAKKNAVKSVKQCAVSVSVADMIKAEERKPKVYYNDVLDRPGVQEDVQFLAYYGVFVVSNMDELYDAMQARHGFAERPNSKFVHSLKNDGKMLVIYGDGYGLNNPSMATLARTTFAIVGATRRVLAVLDNVTHPKTGERMLGFKWLGQLKTGHTDWKTLDHVTYFRDGRDGPDDEGIRLPAGALSAFVIESEFGTSLVTMEVDYAAWGQDKHVIREYGMAKETYSGPAGTAHSWTVEKTPYNGVSTTTRKYNMYKAASGKPQFCVSLPDETWKRIKEDPELNRLMSLSLAAETVEEKQATRAAVTSYIHANGIEMLSEEKLNAFTKSAAAITVAQSLYMTYLVNPRSYVLKHLRVQFTAEKFMLEDPNLAWGDALHRAIQLSKAEESEFDAVTA